MYEAGNIALIIGTLLAAGFLVDYLTGTPWRSSTGGRLFVAGLTVLTAVLALAVVRNLFGDFPGHAWVRLAVYSAGALTIGAAWWIHRRVRCRTRRH